MKQTTCSYKLNEILSSSQFQPRNGESDDLTIRTEKQVNSSLHQLMKQGKISEKIHHRLRTTGSQPARLYGLAKVHKMGTPLQPVLSIPGSSYENLNKFLSPIFGKLPDANIETNSKDVRTALEATKLDEDELVVSLDVKSLYTNVPVEKAIEIALIGLYSSDEVLEIPRSAMKSLLRLAVTKVHFKCNKMWYTQSDGLAMGASLGVILANLLIKYFEKTLQKPKKGREIKTPDTKVICIDCNRRVTFRGKGVECESCKNWFHAKCQGITDTEYQTMQEIVWICSYCAEKGRKEDTLELKLFKRYVDDIVCTVKGNPLDYLEYANSLHKNLQFILETPNGSGDLAFLDLNINLNEDRNISCHWYQKSTDTGIILNFRSCAPLQHKRNVIQGTVHRIFNATSDWQSFDVALKKNQEIWTENQYPTEWSSSIVNETLDKIVTKEKVTLNPPQNEHHLKKVKRRELTLKY